MTDDKAGLGWRVTVSDTGQRSNGIGLSFDNSLVTSKPLEQSGHKGLVGRGVRRGSPQISWKSGNSKRAAMAASELTWSVGRRWEEERDPSGWSHCGGIRIDRGRRGVLSLLLLSVRDNERRGGCQR